MSIKELVGYRVPQMLRRKFYDKRYSGKTFKPLLKRGDIKLPQYSERVIKAKFEEFDVSFDYPVFDRKLSLLENKNWRGDATIKKVSPLEYSWSINRQDMDRHGDVKYVSEISRMHFLPFLCLWYLAFKNKKTLEKINDIVFEWVEQNPYLNSINWTSGIEVGIRAVNLVYSLHILSQCKGEEQLVEELDERIRLSLASHYHFLKNHLSQFSSANNHLMAELMALNVLCAYFDKPQKEVEKWKSLLFEEIKTQVNDDGVHMELCTRYHSEVLDQIIVAQSFLKAIGHEYPKEILERLGLMFNFVSHVNYYGIETIFGDSDEGYILYPYFDNDFSLYTSQLGTANFLFNFKFFSNGQFDFRNYLLFGEDFIFKAYDAYPSDTIFKKSGYLFCYDHEHLLKLSFDFGKIGDDLSSAHGHSDQFHFNLQVGDKMIFTDAGTYQYHENFTFWRNYFRGISAHNTISINGLDHAIINSRMSWVMRPKQPEILRYESNSNSVEISVQTEAFLGENVVHQRTIQFSRKEKSISVKDNLTSLNSELYTFDYFLNLHPEIEVDLLNTNEIIINTNKEIVAIYKNLNRPEFVIGDSEKPLGWYSPSFGKLQQAKVLHFKDKFVDTRALELLIKY